MLCWYKLDASVLQDMHVFSLAISSAPFYLFYRNCISLHDDVHLRYTISHHFNLCYHIVSFQSIINIHIIYMPHPAVLNYSSWLPAQDSFLASLRNPFVVLWTNLAQQHTKHLSLILLSGF